MAAVARTATDRRRWDWETVAPTPADDPGWLHVGNLIAWDTTRLRIFGKPDGDGVRVDRPQSPPASIEIPKPEPLAPEPIQFSVSVRNSRHDSGISVRLRFLPSRGREHLTFPVISMQVPRPPDANARQSEWTTWLAGSRMNVIEMPDAFLITPAPDRVPMIREGVYACLR